MDTHINCIGCNNQVEIQGTNCPSCDKEIKLSIKHFVESDQILSAKQESSQLAATSEDGDKILAMLHERLIEIEGKETQINNEVQVSCLAVAEPTQAEKHGISLHEKILFMISFWFVILGMVTSLSKPLTGIILVVGALLITPKIYKLLLIRYSWLNKVNLFLISYALIFGGLISLNNHLENSESAASELTIENVQ